MVYRVYVEKKPGLDHEAQSLKNDLVNLLGIERLTNLRLLNRYDVEGIDEALFETAKTAVFSEPPLDNISEALPQAEDAYVFAVEYLPGQFDQRADSAAQCIQLISQGERPLVRSAKVYLLYGALTETDKEKIKKYKNMKDPFILVLGDKEAAEKTVSINVRGSNKQIRNVPLDRFVELCAKLNAERTLELPQEV